jgi:hypothetical protein
MRTLPQLVAALLLGTFAATTFADAHPRLYFANARLLALKQAEDHWVLNLEIHEWQKGPRIEDPARIVTIHFKREPACIRDGRYLYGTHQEFSEALDVLHGQVADGRIHRFGFLATNLDQTTDEYVAVNLKLGREVGTNKPTVLAVSLDRSSEGCPFKISKIS